jgi:hypothetical protein
LVTLFDFLPNIAPDSQRCSEFFIVLSELTKQYRSTYVALSFPDEGRACPTLTALFPSLMPAVKARQISRPW